MATVATLTTRMALDSTAFRQGVIQAANQANASLGSISKEAGKAASVLLSLKRAAETFGSFYLVKEGLGSLIDAQKQLQAIHYTLIAATGSSTQAADAFKFVADESQRMGLVLPEAASGFANLSASATAAGVTLSDQKKLFDAYSKSATSLHLDTTQSNRALLALEQMFAKGKIQAQELRLQLGQAIPGAAQRFQNAVMEMTKGTDLAGKSFDQLLAAGELTTSKFLPALVTALEMSGRGWEEASKGLNSNLNRVRTAWFNLKTDVSSGLFNDVATAGAGLLADNLGRVASAVSLIGAGGLARVLGGQLNSGFGKVTGMIAARQETLAHAMNTRLDTEAVLANAQALRVQADEQVAAAKKQVVTLANNKAAAREAAAQAQRDFDIAAARQLKAQQNVARLAGSTLPGNTRFAGAESAAAAKAQGALTRAQREYNVARAAATALQEEAAVAQSALNKSNIALTATEEALAVAQANVAKTRAAEAAIGGLGAAVGRAAKSFGAFALSLVGGPWGLAVAAIGGIGYAIYSVQKQGEDWRKETEAQGESLKQLAESAKAAAAEYGRLGASMSLTQGIGILDASQKELTDKRDALQKLREEAQHLQAVLDANPTNTQNAISNAFDQRKLEQITARIKELEAELPPAAHATGELSDALRARLTPAVDGLKNAIASVRNGGGLGDFIRNLASPQDVASGIKDIEHAQQLANSAQAAMGTLGDKARKDLLTKGKSRVDQLNAELAVAVANIKAQRLGAEKEAASLADAQASYSKELPDARKADIADKHKKVGSEVDKAAEAYRNLSTAQAAQLLTLKEQRDGTAGASEAQKTLNRMTEGAIPEFNKMTAANKASVVATQRKIVADQQALDLQNLKIDGARKLADMDRELAREQEDRARASASQVEGVGHGSQWNAERQAIDAVTTATRQKMDAESAAYRQAIDLADKQNKTAAERKQIDEDHLAMQGKIQIAGALAAKQVQDDFDAMKAAQGSWANGLKAGIEDFQTQQQNNAAAGKKMIDDLTGGFTSAFTAFASGAETAKSAFGSWIDTMYKQALAFIANKAIQALFDSFSQTGGGSKTSTPGSTAGGWGSVIGNFFNALGSSGGKASGGDVHAWGSYAVAENGPEILKVGHRNILMMGDQSGTVVPNNQIGRAAGNTTVTNIYVQPTSTRRTADQIATANARTQRIASARSA